MSARHPNEAASPPRHRPASWGRAALAGGAFLFVWLVLDPPARYAASAPVFFFRDDFWQRHLHWPGGPLAFAAAWLAQLDYSAWLGASVFTALVATLSLATHRVLRGAGDGVERAWAVPGYVLLLLYAQYDPPVWELGGGVLLAVASLLAWTTWTKRPGVWSWVGYAALATTLFCVAGPFPGLLFIVVAGLHALVVQRKWRAAVLCGAALVPWWFAVFVAQSNDLRAVVQSWGRAPSVILVALLYGFFPIAILASGRLSRWVPSRSAHARSSAAGRSTAHARPAPRFAARWLWAWRAGIGGLGVAGFLLTFSVSHRALWRIQAAAEREDWQGVLDAAALLRTLPLPARLQINRALFHTGRLVSDLFTFPQQTGVPLLPSLSDGASVCVPLSETLLELGQVNLAEHYAQEAVEAWGERPAALWCLAQINLVKGRPLAARVYLNVLRGVPFHRAKAAGWLRALDRDPTGLSVAGVRAMRAVQVRADTVERFFPVESLLRPLLQANRQNTMAAEYLMAHLLLTHQTTRAVESLGLWADAGETTLPRSLAEAVLLFDHTRGHQPAALRGLKPDDRTARRFEQFVEALRQNGDQMTLAEQRLAAGFGDTYWFYDVFGRNPGRAGATLHRGRP
jgi:hypothetical protein